MRTITLPLRCLAIGIVYFCCTPWASSGDYSYVDLYTLQAPSGYDTVATGVGYPTAAFGQVAGAARLVGGTGNQAIVWGGSTGSATVLSPPFFTDSIANATNGSQQVGNGAGAPTGAAYHALLWSGSVASVVDLNPSGFNFSEAYGISASQQVGYGYGVPTGGASHALLWSGTAASAVDLNPSGFGFSQANATSGTQQVGYGYGTPTGGNGVYHALLWSGSAASAVDLNPAGFMFSEGLATSGAQQVGYGYGPATGSNGQGGYYGHAVLWSGTAASVVDLNPSGFTYSQANGTNGTIQVGRGEGAVGRHALLWTGSAASVVDLGSLLPPIFSSSSAQSVDSSGDVFGIGQDPAGVNHAIEWVAPAHTASAVVAGGSNQAATAAGRSPTSGQVNVTFPSATAGTFSNINSLLSKSQLSSQTAAFNFALPTTFGLLQTWDLSFSGSFTGTATLTFHYDPGNLLPGFDPSKLVIEHYTNGQWIGLSGTVDPIANTITVDTDSFSPFALGEVPEPSPLALLAVIGVGLLLLRRGSNKTGCN